MPASRSEELPLRSGADVVKARQVVRTWAAELGFSLVDQTKLVTGASSRCAAPGSGGIGALSRGRQREQSGGSSLLLAGIHVARLEWDRSTSTTVDARRRSLRSNAIPRSTLSAVRTPGASDPAPPA